MDRKRRKTYRGAFSNNRQNKNKSFGNPVFDDPEGGARRTARFADKRKQDTKEDAMMGFEELSPGSTPRVGWLLNMVPSVVEDPGTKKSVQAVDLFFIGDSGVDDFRATIIARPYMYLAVQQSSLREAEGAIRKQFRDAIADVSHVQLEDISAPNHLASETRTTFLKVECNTTNNLYELREGLMPHIFRNRERRKRMGTVENAVSDRNSDGLDLVIDIREYDVAPVNRLAIDKKINVGYWYRVSPSGGGGGRAQRSKKRMSVGANTVLHDEEEAPGRNEFSSAHVEKLDDIVERAKPVVLAYDIECTKKPLKFPDPEAGDKVMMISWMVDGQGFLAINRETVSADIENFDYSPHEQFKGSFEVYNEPDEKATLERFFAEVRIAAPRVFVTYNGDYFDWPFVDKRAALLGLDMGKEIGMRTLTSGDGMEKKETRGRAGIHMDVFHWVNRDSYLPQGSRGLKAVTRALLGFEPEEIPPEEMMEAAEKRPHEMARYSVSDAVCTYYLYMKYVHPFTFSLCNIIPLAPDDVLRKGSGTLCEMLLMCQARDKKIIAPNKHSPHPAGKLVEDGRMLESETYIGGHVEALRTGIFRSDLPLKFNIETDAIEELEKNLDETLKFAIEVEGKMEMDSVTNYDEVHDKILEQLKELRENPVREEKPLIYHLDVSAMYPNIILTNRLQPTAIVTSNQCAACDFNGMSQCQRDMEWTWRGEVYPATRGEAEMIQRRAAQEERAISEKKAEEEAHDSIDPSDKPAPRKYNGKKQNLTKLMGIKADHTVASFDNEHARRNVLFRRRLKEYCRSNYKRALLTREESKTATICQRENPFYVDTVRAFRDRRYEYKALLKKQKKVLGAAKEAGDEEAKATADNLVVLYDSLQLAHKCILNSFYGYVMRRGARWYSMEMAGVVTHTGKLIIQRAREFIDRVGLPLELDTDGIWCTLPISFPENFTFKSKAGRKHTISYIGTVFNADVAANFTNHQYQDLVDSGTFEYERRSECSIMFEVDGPYRAMVLPASLEEGKTIKKRYAVFNDDGSLAELKGFEIKRRGELKLIKNFQGEVFDKFLNGETIADCYTSVGETCNKWLDVLTTKGEGMNDDALLELLVEQNNMSKPLDHYITAGQKSCAITCATRMSAFLGADVAKDSGLATYYVISKKPEDSQVTERAIPSMIFGYGTEGARRALLQKWTKMRHDADYSLRNLIDWEYYKGRLANAVLKIVTIPAAMQFVDNPVPRIEYPPWLVKRIGEMKDTRKQKKISSFFKVLPKGTKAAAQPVHNMQDTANNTANKAVEDIEDMPLSSYTAAKIANRRAQVVIKRRKEEKKKKVYTPYVPFKSSAKSQDARREESRKHMMQLLSAKHPDKRYDYRGWVKYAKRVWREQRAARIARIKHKQSRLEAGYEAIETIRGTIWQKPNKRAKGSKDSSHARPDFSDDEDDELSRAGPTVDYVPDHFINDCSGKKTSFFFRQNTPLMGLGVMWQVVSIAPSPRSFGEFKMWVLPVRKEGTSFIPGNLHCIPLHMDRVLYCSSKGSMPPSIEGAHVKQVKGMLLPRSRPHSNMFRVELSEDRFRTADKELTAALTDASAMDGVYGSKTPLDYEAILSLGTLCAPRKHIQKRFTTREVLKEGLHLHDVMYRSPEAVPYLRESLDLDAEPTVNQAFIYGSHAGDGSSRAMYLVVAPSSKIATAVVVTASGSTSVNLTRIWRRLADAKGGDSQPTQERTETQTLDVDAMPESEGDVIRSMLPDDVEFSVHAFKTRAEAWADIGSILSSLRSGNGVAVKNRGSGFRTVLVAQWPALDATGLSADILKSKPSTVLGSASSSARGLEECVGAARQFPVVYVSSNAGDGNYLPVGWENRAALTAMSRFTEMGTWLPRQLYLSRFAGIPVGNVSVRDVHAQALDVLVGRALCSNNHVLWASASQLPDLGGLEAEDNLFDDGPTATPEHSTAGSHRVVCVDTELSNLAVATLLSSSHVNQLEGTDLAFDAAAGAGTGKQSAGAVGDDVGATQEGEIGGKTAAPLDEMASSAPAFRVLRDLVTNWDKMASDEEHPEAAATCKGLLSHVHRWIRSEGSLLHDPALARFLGWLIRKVFRQLINELQGLGATIVYASMSRLILATPKTKTMDGLRYAGFLEKTIKTKPLFRHISFSPLLAVYSGILFVDRFNYGALPAPEEADILDGVYSPSCAKKVTSRDIPGVRMMWDLARYLPVPVAVLWKQVLEEFIRRPIVQRLRYEEELEAKALENELLGTEEGDDEDGMEDANNPTKKLKKLVHKPRGDGYADEVRSLIRKLTGHLLEKVQEIREKTPRLTFPDVPTSIVSSATHRRNPALEFVRTLCHIMSLDAAGTEDVGNLRRSLLRLLGVREFAKESQFVDPSLPVPLHDAVCSYCNTVVDLDLARDARLWGDDKEGKDGAWACEVCGHPYDVNQLELDLVRVLQKAYAAYQVQDLTCVRCRMAKRENMLTHCACSGAEFQLTISQTAFKQQIRAMKSVAEFHSFELLKHTTTWMAGAV